MLKYIWAGLIVLGVLVGAVSGNMEAVSDAVVSGAQEAAELCISMIGIYALWMGLLNIANEAGLVNAIAKRLERVMRLLFRGLRKGSEAIGYITLNMVANMLGMGNAATPFGLKAMQALKDENGGAAEASDDMCMFIIINTASVQLLPLTIIAVRTASGSSDPTEIVGTSLIATFATAVIGVLFAKLCAIKGRRRKTRT